MRFSDLLIPLLGCLAVTWTLAFHAETALAQDAGPVTESPAPLLEQEPEKEPPDQTGLQKLDVPAGDVPAEVPSSDVPAEVPSSDVPAEVPSSDVPAEVPSSNLSPSTFAQAKSAPAQEDAANYEVLPPEPSGWLLVPRVLFFLPRAGFYLANIPVRQALRIYDQFEVGQRIEEVFFDNDLTYGLYPTAVFETGFGLTFGAKFVHNDLFRTGAQLRVRAGFGGEFRQVYRASLRLDNALPKSWSANVLTKYVRSPKERFFGFGNNDDFAQMIQGADPFAIAADTRYGQTLVGTTMVATYAPVPRHFITTELGHSWRRYFAEGEFSEEQALARVYDTTQVAGFDEGVHQLTTKVQYTYDSRRGYTQWDPDTIPSSGVLLSTFGSANVGVGRSDHIFARIGGQVESAIRVGQGPRILSASLVSEATISARGDVPFDELPALGGGTLLRGYNRNQFRDPISMVGKIEYSFDASRVFRMALFADAGRTFPDLEALSIDDMRVGFGAELRLVLGEQVAGSVSVASSIDGGLFALVSFQ